MKKILFVGWLLYSLTAAASLNIPSFINEFLDGSKKEAPAGRVTPLTPEMLSGIRTKLTEILNYYSKDVELATQKKLHYFSDDIHPTISKIYPSTNFVFELKAFPKFIFKMSLTDIDQVGVVERVENSRKGQAIIQKLGLRHIIIPWTQILDVKTENGKVYHVAMEEKVELMHYSSPSDLEQYLETVKDSLNVPTRVIMDRFDQVESSFAAMQSYEYFAYFAQSSPAVRNQYLSFFKELSKFITNFEGRLEIKPTNFPLEKHGKGILIADFDFEGRPCSEKNKSDRDACREGHKRSALNGIGKLIEEPMLDQTWKAIHEASEVPFMQMDAQVRAEKLKRFQSLKASLQASAVE